MLASKRPVPGSPANDRPALLAYREPVPPPLPVEAFVAASPTLKALPRTAAPTTTVQTPPPESPGLVGGPAAEPSPAPSAAPGNRSLPLAAIAVSRQKPAGAYGHAPDHSWLQGIFDRSPDGRPELRYARPADEDAWGGKVALMEDPRWAQLRPGDVIRVEGEGGDRGGGQRPNLTPPSYRARGIWLIQRAD